MNCLEFRRRLLTDPRVQDEAFRRHAATCAECAREAERMSRLDSNLQQALNVPPPEGLEARILLAQSLREERRLFGLSLRHLALAASLFLTLGVAGWLGFQWTFLAQHSAGLPSLVLNHINDELHHLHVDEDVEPDQLARLFSRFGASIDSDIGHVNYAGVCGIRRHSGVHLILPGQEGPVSVLFMPGEYPGRVESVRSARFEGKVIPTSYGSMAVVGERGEPLSKVADRLGRVVNWKS